METYLFNWVYVPSKDFHTNLFGGNEAQPINAQFRGDAIAKFFAEYEGRVKGITFEGSESENRLGLSDIDKNFLEKRKIKLEFGEKAGCIIVLSIERFGDPVK